MNIRSILAFVLFLALPTSEASSRCEEGDPGLGRIYLSFSDTVEETGLEVAAGELFDFYVVVEGLQDIGVWALGIDLPPELVVIEHETVDPGRINFGLAPENFVFGVVCRDLNGAALTVMRCRAFVQQPAPPVLTLSTQPYFFSNGNGPFQPAFAGIPCASNLVETCFAQWDSELTITTRPVAVESASWGKVKALW